MGAVLEGCDGKPADRLAAENVGAFEGRWFLASRRFRLGGQLFVDRGNPFVARPARCRFLVNGTPREVALAWRPIAPAALAARLHDRPEERRGGKEWGRTVNSRVAADHSKKKK